MTLHTRVKALAAALATAAPPLLFAAPSASAEAVCPGIYSVAIPGTTQTSVDADPLKPVGVLGKILEPLREHSKVRMATYYTNYPATIVGGTDGGGYKASKDAGIDASNARLKTVADKCPKTVFILSGYSQGADAPRTSPPPSVTTEGSSPPPDCSASPCSPTLPNHRLVNPPSGSEAPAWASPEFAPEASAP